MFQFIEFKNFRVLRDTTLPLQPFTLILGPNGSGKSTALQALLALQNINRFGFSDLASVASTANVTVTIRWAFPSTQGSFDWFEMRSTVLATRTNSVKAALPHK
jgi:ABC-type Mn2+/Zn2+ transport system ATPase subunit